MINFSCTGRLCSSVLLSINVTFKYFRRLNLFQRKHNSIPYLSDLLFLCPNIPCPESTVEYISVLSSMLHAVSGNDRNNAYLNTNVYIKAPDCDSKFKAKVCLSGGGLCIHDGFFLLWIILTESHLLRSWHPPP